MRKEKKILTGCHNNHPLDTMVLHGRVRDCIVNIHERWLDDCYLEDLKKEFDNAQQSGTIFHITSARCEHCGHMDFDVDGILVLRDGVYDLMEKDVWFSIHGNRAEFNKEKFDLLGWKLTDFAFRDLARISQKRVNTDNDEVDDLYEQEGLKK